MEVGSRRCHRHQRSGDGGMVVVGGLLQTIGRVGSVGTHRGRAELSSTWRSQLKYRFDDSLLLRVFVIIVAVVVIVIVVVVVACFSSVFP